LVWIFFSKQAIRSWSAQRLASIEPRKRDVVAKDGQTVMLTPPR